MLSLYVDDIWYLEKHVLSELYLQP
jgi:hypothetical protein